MGIPYSKEIRSAFDQVTPLVAAGFEVLQTTKNISILLAAIQVLTAFLLLSIQLTLFFVLLTINPDLEPERRALVNPPLRLLAAWALRCSKVGVGTVLGVLVVALGLGAGVFVYRNRVGIGERYVQMMYGVEGGPVGEVEGMLEAEGVEAGKAS